MGSRSIPICARPHERLSQVWGIEEVYPKDYARPREARAGLSRDLAFSNHERPHQALNYPTPAEMKMYRMSRVSA
jgi:hypothetical protein